MRTTRTSIAVLGAAAVLIAGGAAQAWDMPEGPDLGEFTDEERAEHIARARGLYEDGKAMYEEGLYDQAVLAFEESYALSGEPDLLFNLANTFERMGDVGSALDALIWYRPHLEDEAEKEQISRRIANLQQRLDAMEPAPPPDEETAIEPAIEPVVEPAVEPAVAEVTRPHTARSFHPAGGVLMLVGGGLGAGFGIVAGTTYADSRDWAAAGDRTQYEDALPLNNASFGLAIAGAGVFVVGVIVGAAAADGGARPTPTVSAAPTLDGGFAAQATWTW